MAEQKEKIYCAFNNTKEDIHEKLKKVFKIYVKNNTNPITTNKNLEERVEQNSKMH